MIRINETWLIGTSECAYIVYEDKHRTTKRDGKVVDVYKPIAYYGTLEKALQAVISHERLREAQTLDCDLRTALDHIRTGENRLIEQIIAAFPGKEVIIRETNTI